MRRQTGIKVCIFLILLFFSFPVVAEDFYILEQIEINGNKRTKPSVFFNELGFTSGDEVNRQMILDGISALRNTGLFSTVEYKIEGQGTTKTLHIEVHERWTTIPVLKFASGGGVKQLTLGVYDPNLFGEYVEAGGQYERLGDTSSGVIWFKNPRIFATKNGIEAQIWRINRLRTKYFQETDRPVIKTGFLHSRSKLYIGYSQEWSSRLSGKLFYEYNDDGFSDKFTSSEVKAILDQKGLPPASTFHFLGFGLNVGRINHNNHLADGSLFGATLRYGYSSTDDTDDFWQTDLSFIHNKTVFSDMTFAQRFLAGFTTTKVLQYWYYLGGLDRIRGFSDNRFAGRYFWLSNSELRAPTWQNKTMILQTKAFVDIASTAESADQLNSIDGASVGLGLNIIFPKVYRLVLRLDYAEPIINTDDRSISFGVQQFF